MSGQRIRGVRKYRRFENGEGRAAISMALVERIDPSEMGFLREWQDSVIERLRLQAVAHGDDNE